jgi:drug/metabolite transporter (DMT)-like permease
LIFFGGVALFSNIGQLGIELVVGPHVPAGEMTLIVSLMPIFVLLLAGVMRSETITPRKIAGILLGVAASSAILLPRAMEGDAPLFWVALTFAAPISQALGMVLMVRFWPIGLEPMQVATGNLVLGTFLLVPVVVVSGGSLGLTGLWSAGGVATGVFGLTVAAEFYLLAILTRSGGAVLASCADFIAVGAGLGFGYALFAEVPSAWMVIAAALCLLAMKLVGDKHSPGNAT